MTHRSMTHRASYPDRFRPLSMLVVMLVLLAAVAPVAFAQQTQQPKPPAGGTQGSSGGTQGSSGGTTQGSSAGDSKSSAVKPNNMLPRGEKIPGYTVLASKGFTLIVCDETMRQQETSALKRKPLEVLEMELDTIVRLLPADAVKALRNVLIWVEWEQRPGSPGAMPGAVAVYYGGHQAALAARGMHPFKARNITILNMRSLANEHQPDRDSGRCVILHEFTHAVHDQLFGMDNPVIIAAYKQAMELKLYDPNMYASTSPQEYFAELTCSYFDQSSYHPRTMLELQKHDMGTFRLMQSVWGRRRSETLANAYETPKPPVDLRIDEVDLGRVVTGTAVSDSHTKGRPVLVLLWSIGSPSSMISFQRINVWQEELGDFGLTSVALHLNTPGATSSQEIRKVALSRAVKVPVHEVEWTNPKLMRSFQEFPKCLLFDHTGQCVFSGSPSDVETELRRAVGSAIVAGAGITEFPKPLVPLVENLRSGKPPNSVIGLVAPHVRSSDAEMASAAQKLLAELIRPGEQILAEAEKIAETDPVTAFLMLERLPTTYRGTALATTVTTTLGKLKREPAVSLEMRARPGLVTLRKIDQELNKHPAAGDPTSPAFRRDNSAMLKQLLAGVQQMQQTFPTAQATQEAVRMAERYGFSAAKP